MSASSSAYGSLFQDTGGSSGGGGSMPAQLFMYLLHSLTQTRCFLDTSAQYPKDAAPKLRDGQYFDYIIVGGGTAGIMTAHRLVQYNSTWTVLLLEAGGLPNVDSEIPSLMFNGQNTEQDWQYRSEAQPGQACLGFENDRCQWPRGKVLGGSGALNAMLFVQGRPPDYDQWASNVPNAHHWRYENVQRIFDMLVSYPEHVSRYRSYQPIRDAIVEHFGSHSFYESNQTIYNGLRSNGGRLFLNNPRILVAQHATVQRVLLNSKGQSHHAKPIAYGVRVLIDRQHSHLKPINVFARREIILSAGTVNTPQILLRSGIGDRKTLSKVTNIKVKAIVPEIGANMYDHLAFVGLYVKMNEAAFATTSDPKIDDLYEYFAHRRGIMAQIGITNLIGFPDQLPGIQVHHVLHERNSRYLLPIILRSFRIKPEIAGRMIGYNQQFNTFHFVPTLLYPKSHGWVQLNSTHAHTAPPLIHANYLADAHDMEVLLSGIRAIEEALDAPLLRQYQPEILDLQLENCTQFAFRSDEYWRCAIRHLATSMYHPVGTCAMGRVVDSMLRVRGVRRLRVADASIMPSIPGGNTNAAAMMIGWMAAHVIGTAAINGNLVTIPAQS